MKDQKKKSATTEKRYRKKGDNNAEEKEAAQEEKKDDDKRDPLMFGKYKTFKRKLKENNDNNNIMLKQVLDSIDRVEQKIDEKNGFKDAEVTVEAEKEYVSFRDKYKA